MCSGAKLGGEIRFGPRRGLRGLDQGRTYPAVALAGLAAAAFTGAFVLAWAQSAPRDQVTCGGKPQHVWSNLGHDDLGCAATDAGDRVQVVQGDLKRALTLRDLRAESVDRLVQEVNMGQDFADQ